MESAERAVALDENDNVSHWALGEVVFHAGQIDRALTHMSKAVALNPNDADVLAVSGYIQCAAGDAELGFRQMEMAMEAQTHRIHRGTTGCMVYVSASMADMIMR